MRDIAGAAGRHAPGHHDRPVGALYVFNEISGQDGMESDCDIIIMGAGAAGLTAAIVAADAGLFVRILEKTDLVGGATAYAAGGAFLPGCHHLPPEDVKAPLTYLEHKTQGRLDRALVERLLRAGPQALAYLEGHSEIAFQGYGGLDYDAEAPGARNFRTVTPVPFDGRVLGRWLKHVRPPLEAMTIFGGMQVDYADIARLLRATRSPRDMLYATGLLSRHLAGLLRYGRSPRMVFGNAFVGRLLKSVLDRADRIELLLNTAVSDLLVERGRVSGVRCSHKGQSRELRARRGVLIASGGFSGNRTMREQRAPFPADHLSLPPSGNSGDGISAALAAGASLSDSTINDYCYTPVSRMVARSGREILFPHFGLDRCYPGAIAVNGDGRRFVNEAAAYSDFVPAMHANGAVPAYLICDHRFLRRYGLGLVRPSPLPYRSFVRNGYLTEAKTLDGLARNLGISAEGLRDSVARNNGYAQTGIDLDFAKGRDAYSRSMGDPSHGPNPCIGPIAVAPFYAIRLYPGDTSSTAGLAADAQGRVLDKQGEPIPGLHVAGADMANPFLGTNPSGGCNIGPAMTVGYLAAKAIAAQIPQDGDRPGPA